MGYMRHHAIVVTSWKDDAIWAANKVAQTLFPWVSPLSACGINGYLSFFIPPDGSKEGWEESDAGDAVRDAFIEYLRSTRFEDGSSYLVWVEVQFGDDSLVTVVTRDSDEERRGSRHAA